MINGIDTEGRVAVLVDCDNTTPEILDHALRVVAQFERVVLRRGYGNHTTLANNWQEALVQQAFTPSLRYQYAAGKNTSDIALALDTIEVLFDDCADTFFLVTSDSDFAYLCRTLRERGATVHIVGESKSPDALRNASDQFFEWQKPAQVGAATAASERSPRKAPAVKAEPAKAQAIKPAAKLRPKFVVEALNMLAADPPEGKITVSALGSHLKRTDPEFSPQTYGHSALLGMIKTYDLLVSQQEQGGHWSVRLAPMHAPDAGYSAAAPET